MNNRIRYTLDEIQRNIYYQMPKFLFEGELENLSNDARVLYSLLRDRHELSIKNQWVNENGEVYLIFSRENMCAMLKLSKPTVIKAMNDLKKYNLIEEKRLGQGKANHIYLLQVDTSLTYEKVPQTLENIEKERIFTSRSKGDFSEVKNIDFKNENSFTSESQDILPQEVKNFYPINNDFKKIYKNDIENESDKSGQLQSYPQSKNDMTMTDTTDHATQQEFSEMKKEPSAIIPTPASKGLNESPSENAQSNFNQYTTYAEWESRVKNNIGYEYFIQERQPYIKLIDTIVHNIITILTETNDFIILNKKENKKIRTVDAKEICLRLKYDHILYVLEKFKNVSDPVTHKGNYLKSMILSSLEEMEAYYQNEYRQGNL